jgi:hypothetical protein
MKTQDTNKVQVGKIAIHIKWQDENEIVNVSEKWVVMKDGSTYGTSTGRRVSTHRISLKNFFSLYTLKGE